MTYEIGSRIGDYEIIQVLGTGGMGRVYKVRNIISDRIEAMKVLLPDLEGSSDLADRFIREIKVQAKLDHPNIAVLHTALRMNNQLLMLMEYVEGRTLADIIQSGPVGIPKAIDYGTQVLSALAYAHSHGVVHRDVKPANIMIAAGGEAKLMDFGIARMALDSQITKTGSTVGSLSYMSPEQIKGGKEIDWRSDLYSFGVTLYETVTNVRPFQGDSGYTIMVAHLESIPKPPIEISPNLPQTLSDIILQALEKDPAKRIQTADAFRSALLNVGTPESHASTSATTQTITPPGTSTSATIQTTTPPDPGREMGSTSLSAAPRTKRSRRGVWIAAGLALALLVLVAVAVQIPKLRRSAAENEPVIALTTPSVDAAQTPKPTTEEESTELRIPALPVSEPERELAQNASKEPASSLPPSKTILESKPKSPSKPADILPKEPKLLEQIKEIRKQYNRLSSVRGATVKEAIEIFNRQKTTRNFRLQTEVANAARLMEFHFAETDAALDRQDVQEAKRNLGLALREVEKLEKFLRVSNLLKRRPAAKRKLP